MKYHLLYHTIQALRSDKCALLHTYQRSGFEFHFPDILRELEPKLAKGYSGTRVFSVATVAKKSTDSPVFLSYLGITFNSDPQSDVFVRVVSTGAKKAKRITSTITRIATAYCLHPDVCHELGWDCSLTTYLEGEQS